MSQGKLNPEFKEKLLTALRSGEYPKAKHNLFNGTGYCCLGVAAKICGIPDESLKGVGFFSTSNLKQGVLCTGPFGGGDPIVNGDQYPRELLIDRSLSYDDEPVNRIMSLNDSHDTFDKVAEFIEENL